MMLHTVCCVAHASCTCMMNDAGASHPEAAQAEAGAGAEDEGHVESAGGAPC